METMVSTLVSGAASQGQRALRDTNAGQLDETVLDAASRPISEFQAVLIPSAYATATISSKPQPPVPAAGSTSVALRPGTTSKEDLVPLHEVLDDKFDQQNEIQRA